eukprot:829728-Amphidinium_carterae.1
MSLRWLPLIVSQLELVSGTRVSRPRCWSRYQCGCLVKLALSLQQFFRLHSNRFPICDLAQHMRDHQVAYDGSVILAAEALHYNRIVPALPPRGAAG